MKRYTVDEGWDGVFEEPNGEWVEYKEAALAVAAERETLFLAQRELAWEREQFQKLMDEFMALKGDNEKLRSLIQLVDAVFVPHEHRDTCACPWCMYYRARRAVETKGPQ